jgi:hypothetical protein
LPHGGPAGRDHEDRTIGLVQNRRLASEILGWCIGVAGLGFGVYEHREPKAADTKREQATQEPGFQGLSVMGAAGFEPATSRV